MRRFSVHCYSQFVVVAAYQKRKFSIFFNWMSAVFVKVVVKIVNFVFVNGMQHVEESALATCQQTIPLWFCYVEFLASSFVRGMLRSTTALFINYLYGVFHIFRFLKGGFFIG